MDARRFAVVATASFAFAACIDRELDVELAPLPELGQPIVYGATTGAMDSAGTPLRHKATVALHHLARGGRAVYVSPFCSGTLIDADVVLTAGHCVVNEPADRLAVYVGNDPTVRDESGTYDVVKHLYRVSENRAHPDYNGWLLLNDVALLRLSSDVVESPPAPVLRADNGFTDADIGAALDFVGFGQDEDGDSGTKLHGVGQLGGFGCAVDGCPFEGYPTLQISYPQGTLGGAQSGEPGPCFGDSGGPSFLERAGVHYVGGITSWGDGECDQYGVSTRVDAYAGFIDAFLVEGGGGGGSCGNGVCDEGESCDGRDGTIACDDCQGKTRGKPSERFCEVG